MRPPILVTGGSRGIGHATAASLAADGRHVIRWSRSVRATEGEGKSTDTHIIDQTVDVSDAASVTRAVAELAERCGALSGIVVNAGNGTWAGLAETSNEVWARTIGVNLTGAFLTIRSCLPLLMRGRPARVVALASDSAFHPFAGRAAYCASKAGLVAMMECLRQEYRASEINVTVVAPARVDTYFGGKRPGDRPQGLSAAAVGRSVANVFKQPDEVEVREIRLASVLDRYGPGDRQEAR
ncbi:SDR family oxidoreductase [Kineosporia babensis]|uniref:SDR family oxidoreductase n=1 Tax=Kineosporia babensis TaxID=499548 RepID=A0A9X1NLC0_9ACTN|nr:SDR family oxidoreductase [Kineosporia babensis]MCD5317137.1 SDR family oxidoreductase [Kineosporia babensis]